MRVVLAACAVLVARVVGGWGVEGSLHTALGDWQTDLYNCTVILSQVVGFTIFPHSHVHSPTRDMHRSTSLSVAETYLVVVLCFHLTFIPYIFRHCGLLILKVISIQAHRNVERECACAWCVCWTN